MRPFLITYYHLILTSRSEASCESTWKEALQSTLDILGEDDFEFVQNFESAEHMLLEVYNLQEGSARSTITRSLKNLRPSLIHLQAFGTFIAISIRSESINLACMWGVTYLLIQVSRLQSTSITKF